MTGGTDPFLDAFLLVCFAFCVVCFIFAFTDTVPW